MAADHVKRACDRLQKLWQTKSVSCYLSDFVDIVLTVEGMHHHERIDERIVSRV